ncbi:pimeloyl-ACP methyl ester carboxylesterase [Sagittula marina]|uniref:Pimeloyl-ACP methyl ester carboxylesterase n=1 Tax=Sagittula marina TaxID=943940 RepID=A0A7W6DMY3_9RHOB|nr:alpha/beta hydrolase [Sagittula marina]MBB3985539.1 pimeloyl-ACP methyl ester carboxylesterase [Sagittula marina]
MTQGIDAEWTVDGLTYAGRMWGPEDGTPVLALHGWMDHADSFSILAPRLTGCRVVALDLSGQGLSAHRAAHATYNIWDDLPQIAGILDRLGWVQPVLMGHSRGANIAALFAAAQPDRVRALVSLDALAPEPTQVGFAETLGKFVTDVRAQSSRSPRTFETADAYAARRAAQGNSAATSQALAARALQAVDGGYQLRGDRRLFASSAVKLTQTDVEDVLRNLRCPVLNIMARDGICTRPALAALLTQAADLIGDYTRLDLDGDHHFHLDPTVAPHLAEAILTFLDQRDLHTA